MKLIKFSDRRQNYILEKFKNLGYDLPIIPLKKGGGLKGKAFRKASLEDTRIMKLAEKRLSKPEFRNKIDKTDALILAYYLLGQTSSETIDWLNSKDNCLPNRFKNLKKSGYFKRLKKLIGTLTAKPKPPIQDPIEKAIFEDRIGEVKWILSRQNLAYSQLNRYLNSATRLNRIEFVEFFSEKLKERNETSLGSM